MTPRPELFASVPNDILRRSQQEYQNGAAALSEYTLTQMPSELRLAAEADENNVAAVYTELAARQQALLENASKHILSNADPAAAEVMQLDLLFMRGGYLPGGAEADACVPGLLLALIAYNKERFGLPDHMTYHLLIDVNVREFMRTGSIRIYSDGAEAITERDFYAGHYYAEPHIKSAAYLLETVLENPTKPNKIDTLSTARDAITIYEQSIQQFGAMPAEHYAYFRRFLVQYPDGTPNASGAHQPSPQILEAVIHPPTQNYQRFLDSAMPYFPAWAQPIIAARRQASLEGHNIFDAIKEERLPLTEEEMKSLGEVIIALYNAKLTHAGVAYRHIPQAFAGGRLRQDNLGITEEDIFHPENIAGTGGYDPKRILANGLRRLMTLYERLSRGLERSSAPGKGKH